MSVPSSPRLPEWQPPRIPKLAYRKPIPQEELENFQAEAREPIQNPVSLQRMDSTFSSATRQTMPSASIFPPKKKNSFFGGLFAKEPTLIALAQVEADLKAKHGAATAQNVPHVSSRKMPEHVPKVNTRWDGIPETVKQREREEKQKRRASQRNSTLPPTGLQIENVDGVGNDRSNVSRRQSDADNDSEQWQQWGRHTGANHLVVPAHSVTSGESRKNSLIPDNSSNDPQSLRSPSGSSLPEITAFFPHQDLATPPPKLGRWESDKVVATQPKPAPYRSPSDFSSNPGLDSSIDGTTTTSFSATTDPRDFSPASPTYYTGIQVAYDNEKQVANYSEKQVVPDSGKQTVKVKNFSKPNVRRSANPGVEIDAFLAGEAKPLQLDDDGDDEDEITPHADLTSRQPARTLTHRSKQDSMSRNDASKRRGIYIDKVSNADILSKKSTELSSTSRKTSISFSPNQAQGRFVKKQTTPR